MSFFLPQGPFTKILTEQAVMTGFDGGGSLQNVPGLNIAVEPGIYRVQIGLFGGGYGGTISNAKVAINLSSFNEITSISTVSVNSTSVMPDPQYQFIETWNDPPNNVIISVDGGWASMDGIITVVDAGTLYAQLYADDDYAVYPGSFITLFRAVTE